MNLRFPTPKILALLAFAPYLAAALDLKHATVFAPEGMAQPAVSTLIEETARRTEVRMEDPYRLMIETFIATGARVSEVIGLKWKNVDLAAGMIKIEQRVWHQEVGQPKTEGSRRVLGIGEIVDRCRAKLADDAAEAGEFVFQQKRAPGRPLWDSGVQDALHHAAEAEGCDFPGLGPHSFRRANITWRQEVGGSAIEASKIAGHSGLEMTGEYTFVTPERQNELTQRIQHKLTAAGKEVPAEGTSVTAAVPAAQEEPQLATTLIQ